MNTRTLRKLVERGLVCVGWNYRGASASPTFRSKHFAARRLRHIKN